MTDTLSDESERPGGGLSLGVASLALVAVCLALGATSAFETRLISTRHGNPIPWDMILQSTAPRWLLLAVLLPLALRLAWRVQAVPMTLMVGLVHAGAFLVLSLTQAVVDAWAVGLSYPFGIMPFPWSARIMRSWLNTMPTLVFVYAAILAAAWGMAEARERHRRTLRAAQLEARLQAARLAALRAQVQPHFLYNTLNGIAALVADREPARAVAAIEQLGELLHASLREDGREVIAIHEEVALAEQYLALQRLRFGRRLRYTVRVAPEVEECLVPVLLLQPVVENAVVHGLDAGCENLEVTISVCAAGHGVELRVENDGPDLPTGPGAGSRQGLGLAGTRARLTTAYGAGAAMTLLPRGGGGVVVTIRVPRLTAAAMSGTSPEPAAAVGSGA